MLKFFLIINVLFFWLCLVHAQVAATPAADSLLLSQSNSAFRASNFQPNPKKATIYAAVFPGLGQVYNRKYWKVPILYGGFLGLAYAISWNGKYYNDYRQAYIDIMDGKDDTNSYLNMLPPNVNPNDPNLTAWLPDALRRRKDVYRRWRDMSIAGIFGLYALSVLDAYVDAQLFDFNISPDLSMKIEPVIESRFDIASVGAKVRLRF